MTGVKNDYEYSTFVAIQTVDDDDFCPIIKNKMADVHIFVCILFGLDVSK